MLYLGLQKLAHNQLRPLGHHLDELHIHRKLHAYTICLFGQSIAGHDISTLLSFIY